MCTIEVALAMIEKFSDFYKCLLKINDDTVHYGMLLTS